MSSTREVKEPRPSRAAKPIPKSGHGHFVVQMVINDSDDDPGQISICGSLDEYRTRLIALAEPDTVDVVEQVGPFEWTDGKGKVHKHFIDQVVIKKDGARLGLTDKPYRRVTPEFEAEIAQVAADARCKGIIDQLHLVTEYARNPVRLYNADLMRGCRDADPEVDMTALGIARSMTGEVSLQQLADELHLGPRGFRSLVRLIRSGQLQMVREEKISYSTLVTRGQVLS